MQYVRLLLEKIVAKKSSPKKLAMTFCLGVYIGLSPFVGLRTMLTFFCGWIFALDLSVLFTASCLVHNPWTMIPLCALNHVIGKSIFGFLNIDDMQLEPSWAETCSLFVQKYTGISDISLTAFLVGGNLLGISMSLALYPFIKRLFSLYVAKKTKISS